MERHRGHLAPVRHALGAQIIGLGVYTADRVGQELIEAHTETHDGRGHQEIYDYT
jgi:hypothetical protein